MTRGSPSTFDDTRPAAAPRVSVVSTFLNAERFIAEAIESVLAQDFRDFELILIDDGSTRESTEIAHAYAARYASVIRCFEHEGHRNRGISASRNLGIAMARGEFVAFIDADDVWAPTKLAEQIAIMDARPELGMVCGAARYWKSWNGGTDVIVPTGHVVNVVVPPPEAALALYPLGKAASPCPSDLLLRREVVARLGGFEDHFTGARMLYEDQAFLAKVYLAAPVYFSDRVWINYREHAESCMASVRRDGYYDEVRLYFLNWLERYLSAIPDARPDVRAALQRSLWRFRHPVLYAAAHRSSAMLQTAQRVAGRLKRAVTLNA
jgi:glycosyltransferase involved in cell wall biosynthesis